MNVRRHAQATSVQLALRLYAGAGSTRPYVQLTIADDGRGFDADQEQAYGPAASSHGFGLIGMQERARLLNGTMRISSCRGAGAEVEVRIPLDP